MSPQLLLIDDDADFIAMVFAALDRVGNSLDLVVCHDGGEALEALERALLRRTAQLPRVVLLDLSTRCIDGFRVLRKMRADPGLQELPVVVFSGSGQIEEVERAHDLGASAYCIKPMRFEDLCQVILAILVRWGGHMIASDHRPESAVLTRYLRGPSTLLTA